MDSYEVLMEDLIDCNAEETIDFPHSSWTEQALDLFISILKNVKRDNFSSQQEMLEVIAIKMSERSYRFTIDQIERKYNSLKKMYTEKKEKNQSVEPELSKLFGDTKPKPSVRHQSLETPPFKRAKVETADDTAQCSDKSLDAATEDVEEKKFLWSTESTKMFLDLLEELRPQLGSKLRTKKQMWEQICKRLQTHGFNFTYHQVENKWKALLRHYRGRLELMRNGGTTRIGAFGKSKYSYSAWPELFETTTRKVLAAAGEFSFANDQHLPYDDDGYTDEEPCQFEEACAPLYTSPDVEEVSDETDPVMIEDVSPRSQQQKEKPSTPSEPLEQGFSPQLEKIVNEISSFREDNRKHQSEMLMMKRMELKAYRERTAQFTRIANDFSELMEYLKAKASEEN